MEKRSSYREDGATRGTRLKRLYLLRHAKAEVGDPSLADFDRALTPRGRRAAERIGDLLVSRKELPELVLCSPSQRTRETLELVLPALCEPPQILFERSLYLADSGSLLARVCAIPEGVERAMFIGHNPGIEELAARLTRRDPSGRLPTLADKFPTAALAILVLPGRWEQAPDGGRLEDFIRPRDLDS
jgi:phosphohistidine phosphatase